MRIGKLLKTLEKILHSERCKRPAVALKRCLDEMWGACTHLGITRKGEALFGNSNHRIEFAIFVGVMERGDRVSPGRNRAKRVAERRARRLDRPVNDPLPLASGKALLVTGQAQSNQPTRVTQPGDLDLDVGRRGRLGGRGHAEAQSCQGHHR